MPTFLTEETKLLTPLDAKQYYLLLIWCFCVTAWPHTVTDDNCPSPKWNVMCRPCCEYHLIQCRCPSKGSIVGYTVPCCRNALDECDPCIIHPGCSLFENCKTCHNGTWKANDDFFVNEKYCTECRQGWSGGNCKTCGGVIQRAQGHIALESYPTNARCEWRVKVEQGRSIELRFSQLSLESDHLCRYDYVEVRDGYDVNSPVIGRFCGDQLPQPIRSSGNTVHILFTSDGYNNFDGFVLTFQESSASTSFQSPACPHLETPINAYLLPVFGLREEFKSVNYRCYPHFTLIGSQQRICLPNGTWSGTAPRCVKEHAGQMSSVWCPPPAKLLNGYFRTISDTAGGPQTIEFFCKNSHILSGSHYITCLSNGSWSSQLPKCVRACREPKVSELVRQSVVKPHRLLSPHRRPSISSRYDMQDVLSAGFIPLALDRQSGNSDAVSEELPRGFHSVHTSITYKCASALYQHSGSSRRTCLKTGRWSGRHVSCSPVCGKFDGFSIQNFTDAPLPWHAAIYIRSPPPHTVSGSHRPSVMTVSRQQGASEESTFWYLACSGALLSQRSVLVAAHCVVEKGEQQPIHPAHVKVVVGRRQRTPREQMKSLQQLRVSEVLVHPNFYSSPDSDVAVLKLKDKAKISTSVLPVCLPETQGGEVTAQEVYASTWMLPNDRKHPGCSACSSQTKLVQLADVSHCEREFAPERARATQINDNTLCVKSKLAPPQSPCPHYIPGITTAPAVFSSTSEGLSGHGMTHRAATAGWQLLGLESLASEETACLQHTHTLHTKVSNFRNWIKENMK